MGFFPSRTRRAAEAAGTRAAEAAEAAGALGHHGFHLGTLGGGQNAHHLGLTAFLDGLHFCHPGRGGQLRVAEKSLHLLPEAIEIGIILDFWASVRPSASAMRFMRPPPP